MPRYLNSDLLNLADATGLKNQMAQDIWSLNWPETVKSGIDSLTSFAQALTPPENPLPIVTTPRPQVQPIQSLDEMERMWGSGNGDIQDTQSSPAGAPPAGAPASAPAGGAPTPAGAPVSLPTGGAIDNSSREAFVRTAYPYALQAADGDPKLAQQLIATAISENGKVGTGRDLGEMGFNVGGIQGVQGPAGSFTALDAGRPRQFAAYNNLSEGFRAVRDLVSQGRYAQAAATYRQTGDIDRYWRDVNNAGYSETPDWQDRIGNIRRTQVEPITQQLQTGAAQTSEVPSGQQAPPVAARPAAQPQAAIDQAALDDPDKWALCGPVAATMAAQRYGPNWTVAQAKALAVKNGLWDANTGMHGLGSEVQLLNGMGIPARTGPASQAALAADAAAGNTPIISTNKHYFVLKGYNPQTGQFDTDTTGTVLRGGSRWLTLDQIAALGGGIQGAAYMDNPTTPAPSAVAGPSQEAEPASSSVAAVPSPASAGGTVPPAEAPDLMLRQPLGPATAGPDTLPTDASAPGVPGASGPGAVAPPAPQVTPGAFQDDYTQSGWVTPGMPPGPPVPDMRGTSNPTPITPPAPRFNPLAGNEAPAQPSELPRPAQPATKPMLPLYDASMNVVGYVQNQAQQAAEAAAPVVQAGYETARNLPSPLMGGVNPVQAVETGAGIVNQMHQDSRHLIQRQNEIQDQAAAWVAQQGRPDRTGGLRAVEDPAWQAANPELAAEYDEISRQMSVAVGGSMMGQDVEAARAANPTQMVEPITSRIRSGLQAGAERAAATDAERAAAGQAGAPAYGTLGMVPPERPSEFNAQTWRSRLASDLGVTHEMGVTGPVVPLEGPITDSTGRVIRDQTGNLHLVPGPNGEPYQVTTYRNFFNNREEVPGTRKPLDSVFRVMSPEEYAQAQRRGYFQSDQRLNLAEGEGTVASAFEPATFYGQPNSEQVIVRLRVDPVDGWRLDPRDTYIKTNQPIPIDRVEGVMRYGTNEYGVPNRVISQLPSPSAPRSTTTYGVFGVSPPDETRIPRAGYATDLSQGAENLVRSASEANAPRETVSRASVAQKAQEILGVNPEAAQRWQNEALAEPAATRAVRGEALRQAEYIDAEHANAAIERLRQAQQQAQNARDGGLILSDADHAEIADAMLQAAEAMRAFERSAAASTAEGRATARALNQRRSAILAGQSYQAALRARQVGQDAAFAAQEALRASRTGELTPAAQQRLRTIRDKLVNPERHGLIDDAVVGRLDDLAQQRASVTPGISPRVGTPLGTRIAAEAGSSLGGGVFGAAAGAALPAETPEERRRNALIGAGAGMLGAPIARRLLGRGRSGAAATFGFSPTEGQPNRAIAVGADPSKRYEFRYRVVDLGDLTASNLPNGAPNPAFPRELQPRERGRVASQLQIDQIAKNLEPDALLTDVGRLDSGPMIVGPDKVVESGNGRTLALRRAAEQYPEQYQAYVDSLRSNLKDYGLTAKDLEGVKQPVLVRERVSEVDRPAFAAEANNAGLLRMSSVEQAAQDARNLSDEVVQNLTVGENDTIATALRNSDNRDLVRGWMASLPANERATVLDASGNLSAQGYERLTNALLMRTYGNGPGERLAQTFIESADPTVRNVQTALMASLPDMARSEALVRSGQREAGLSIAEDVAAATEMLARLRRDGIPVSEFLGQTSFVDRELTPFQEDILRYLDQNVRRPGAIRDTLREYATRVENAADPNQASMFGAAEVAPVSREEMWRGATEAADQSAQARQAARRARADGAGLAQSGPEPLSEAADIVPRGGPEGTLAVQGADEALTRPGPLPEGNIAPAGGPPGALQAPPAASRTEQRALEQSRIRGVVSSIDAVLANPTAPGSLERLQQLHSDLQDISKAGFQRSSDIRARLQRNGLLRAGMASKTEDVTNLVTALANVSPDKPEEMRAVLQIISKPRLIDKLLEYQYVNMLASPITQAINITSNALQIAGRLLLTNPLEYAYSGGQSTGVGAAFQGAARGFREGMSEAGQIMRTGVASADVERAMALGDYGRLNREYLTEQFGPVGAALHMISTRPLAAMDALLGHVAYASAAEQYAQRTADRLLKNGAEAVKGMSREQARAHVMANIWDYPEIIDKAGKIQDYTLLRSKDVEGAGWGRVERALRQMAAIRNPAEDAGFGGQAISFIANNILPFFNVPLNFAKQGGERTVGVPVNAVRAARAYGRGDVERGAELAAKATIGGAALTTAAILAMGDNLTDAGPSDAGQRAVWEQTHRPNSFRVPGTSTWISWDGTPWAIPFGMVAGAKRGWTEAQESATKKGQAEPLAVAGMATLKGAQGAASGFASQSFIRSLGDQYKLITGQDTGLGTVASQVASNVSRFIPASGMVNFLAGVTDAMERDTGRPQSFDDLPAATGARLANRLPGVREQLNPRLDIYGEPTPNERSGLAGALPYYRGSGIRAGDAITQNLEAAGTGAILAPSEVPAGVTAGVPIPLTVPEQRVFNEAAGRAWRQMLEANGAGSGALSPMALDRLRSQARQAGIAAALASIDPAERQRRVQAALQRKAS